MTGATCGQRAVKTVLPLQILCQGGEGAPPYNTNNTKRVGDPCSLSAQTPFVEIRLATQLVSPSRRRPPVKGVDRLNQPEGISLSYALELAWRWRDDGVLPAPDIHAHKPPQAVMQEMVRLDPIAAGILRQQREEIIRDGKEGVTHRFIERVLKLIIKQYGWPEQD